MSDMRTAVTILIFIAIVSLFMHAQTQVFPEGGLNATVNENFTRPTYCIWDAMNPFTYLDPIYEIFTFEVLGLPDDVTTILQLIIYVPLAGILLLMVLYYIRGN